MDEEKEENTQPGHAVQQPGPHTRLTFVHAFLNSSRRGATDQRSDSGEKTRKTRSRRARHHTTTTDEITHDTSLCHTTPGRSYCLCFIILHAADMRKLFVVLTDFQQQREKKRQNH